MIIPLHPVVADTLAYLQDEPTLVVFIAAFGVLIALLVVPLVCHFVFKLLRIRLPEHWTKWLATYATVVWLFGAVSQLLLLAFTPVSALHRIAIWLASAFVILLLCLSHARLLLRGFDEMSERDEQQVLRQIGVNRFLQDVDASREEDE